jgi:hypothetical protein
MPPQDRAGSDDQPHNREALGWQCPGQQRQPRPVRPRQTRMSSRPLTLGDGKLMAQHQDLRVLPPRLPPRQAKHRSRTEHDQEDWLQAHNPKIIPPCGRAKTGPASTEHWTNPTALHKPSAQLTEVFGTRRVEAEQLRSASSQSRKRSTWGRSMSARRSFSGGMCSASLNQVSSSFIASR